MVAEAVYLDLSSSDEDEDDRDHHRNGSTDSTELSYLSKVCNLHVEEDDVVIIDKPPTSNDKVKRDKPRVIRTVMDDDECCMLDTDPAETDAPDCTPPLDSDELVMTGEKGPVACRDFPHARYLCVHFPFKTTPHASFCSQCHCYVCDSLAPCSLWGDGNSAHDHCHASEESPWKTLRKLAKCRPLPSRATPLLPPPPTVAAAAAAAQSALLNRNGMANHPMGATTRFPQPSVSQQAHATSTSPSIQSPGVVGSTPPATLKKHPLVIRLRGKGRGKPSQAPHLGVRSPKPHHRSPPTGNSRSLPLPRSASTPSGSIIADVAPLPTPPAPPHPQFTPYMAPPVSLEGMAPPVSFPHTEFPQNHSLPYTTDTNVASYYAFPAPPLPSSPPPYIPPPPPPCVYGLQPQPQPPGAYSCYPSPGAYDPPPHPLWLPGGDAGVAGFGSAGSHVADGQYVAVMGSQYEDQGGGSQPFDAGRYAAASGYGCANVGNGEEMLAGGPGEAWAADAAALFDSFASGIGGSLDANQQPAMSLEKVLEQMAGDDYLWEQFPCW